VSDAVSVIVATRGDRPDGVERCLAALAAGELLPAEVIVVDQGGGASSPAGTFPFPVHVVRLTGRGLARGRNAGLAASSSPVVAVTDDDVVPTQAWLASACSALASDSALSAVSGAVLPLPDPTGTLVPVSSRTRVDAVTATRSLAPWRLGSGGNLVARRDWLERIGGYDERLGAGSDGLAGEDVDLLHRLLRTGGRLRYEPAVAVRHEQKGAGERRLRRRSYGFGVGAACGIWARSGDASAIAILASWLALRLRLLAASLLRGRAAGVSDELRVLRGTVAGLRYGLRVG